MLALKGHEIRVIDFEILWQTQSKRELWSKRKIFKNVSKIYKNTGITLIRPGIIKIPFIDYISMMLSHWKEIRLQTSQFNPDVILSFGVVAYLAGRAAKKNRIPFVYYWIDVSHRLIPFKFLRPTGWMVERRAIKLASRVLTINKKLREYVIKMGAPPARTRVLTAGIDFGQFDPNLSGDQILKQYELSDKDVVLFFMGWLYQFSGLKEVVAELAKLNDRHVKLLIVGEGDAYHELQEMQEELGLQDRLILAGRRPYREIPLFIAAADICLLPAYPTETIMQDIVPIKMYEYMAMKKTVVATRLPGVVKEFGEGNGVVYVDRPEDTVQKALEIIQDGNLQELGAKARKFAQRYNWERIANEFELILQKAVRENKKCPPSGKAAPHMIE